MTAQLSIFPVTASIDATTAGIAPVSNSGENGVINPFTQLLQGMVARLDEQGQQQSLPFFPGISVSTELTEQGNLLPQDGQALAPGLLPGQYLNPFMTLSQAEINQLATTLEIDADVLNAKNRPAIPAQLANVLQQLADDKSPASFKTEQLPLSLADMTSAATSLTDLSNNQKAEQLITGMAARLAGVVEKAASNKTEGLTNVSQLSPHLLNNHLSSTTSVSGTSTRTDVAMQTMPMPPQHPGWSQAVGERVQWMVNQNMQKAEIRLDPPELGSLEVRVVVQKEHAHVTFAAPHAQVRDALEAAVPRLREMLGEQGLDLTNVDIGHHSFAEQREQNAADEFAAARNGNSSTAETGIHAVEDEENTIVHTSNGLLDTYV